MGFFMVREIMEIALRRGFIFPSYEIYGGVSGFYDYGPLGATLKKNLEDLWRRYFCLEEGFLEVSTPTVAPQEVFMASGHVDSFTDPIVECRECGNFLRADHLLETRGIQAEGLTLSQVDAALKEGGIKCPDCGGDLGEVTNFNLMFKTYIGPGKGKAGYLRPETAQGMFTLFNRLYSFYRHKLPFGIAQVGKAYRNEISPRQGLIRLREFSQAELEIFVDPRDKSHPSFELYSKDEIRLLPRDREESFRIKLEDSVEEGIVSNQFLGYYLARTRDFLLACGIPEERLRFRQHLHEEMAHYARDCWDAEVYTRRFGWIEAVGIADRGDYDLRAHERESNSEIKAFREYGEPRKVKKEVVEPDMSRLGPEFKEEAKEVARQLRALSPEEVEGGAKVEAGGREVTLDKSYYQVREREEKITGEKFYPHVIEPSFGMDRILYALLESSYSCREGKNVLGFLPSVAPIKVSVFPLVKKGPLLEVAREIHLGLKTSGLYSSYEENDSIGRRYARGDEAGVPYAVTVDFKSLEEGTVTLRDRDSTEQVRVKREEVIGLLQSLVSGRESFSRISKT